MRRIALLLIFVLLLSGPFIDSQVYAEDAPLKAAIIIDDFGGDVHGVEQFFQSEIPITVAVMPFLEETKEQANTAHNLGLEVMLHLPLQPKKGKASWLGPNPITKDLSLEEVKNRVTMALDDVPHVKGINNHMGSLIVEDEAMMRAILEVVKERGLYVVDSGTSGKSVLPRLAEEMGIPWTVRDTFLDDTHSSSSHVYKQMNKLAKVAKKKGTAIGIGHVGVKGDETVKGVKKGIKQFFEPNKIEVVPVSELLKPSIEKQPDKFWQY
ncbi:divergent polysaccharide deacetylase family protein [Anaerobacillus sp. MEB173]|uniref:divergent polysaccharide deacetylase family protein n=1 Tax=Anaerobacillus sp. MEB173 TaxID=3383345 RepID=UPI003F9165D7